MSEDKITFSFGANWQDFLKHANERVITGARADIEKWLGESNVKGKRIVDIGCGSGVHSWCYHLMGARELVSLDVDPNSVAATTRCFEQAGKPANWQVLHGSVLDTNFLAKLGTFDIVYSWGVLHHTGQMWPAIENACTLIAPGGLFWIALYVKGPNYQRDLELKQRYNRAGALGKWWMERKWINGLMWKRLKKGKNPFNWNRKKERGMNTYHDLVDWLGGLPYEVVSVEDIRDFCGKHGLTVERVEEHGEGANHIFLLRRAK
ncbi:MAG: class I SAM-dependent methyltransferase [Planctomycetes bacterium]|nr:class I SAM-dependent methyltransferase [Planctomycetota bacterium]